jgi:hypothetical protein
MVTVHVVCLAVISDAVQNVLDDIVKEIEDKQNEVSPSSDKVSVSQESLGLSEETRKGGDRGVGLVDWPKREIVNRSHQDMQDDILEKIANQNINAGIIDVKKRNFNL